MHAVESINVSVYRLTDCDWLLLKGLIDTCELKIDFWENLRGT